MLSYQGVTLVPEFSYHSPATLEEAHSSFQQAEDAAFLAGGMTLLPTIKAGLRAPSALIDLTTLRDPALFAISRQDNSIVVGALATHGKIAHALAQGQPTLSQIAGGIGDPQVRNRGTIGGALANNDPAADWPAAVLGFGATLETTRRRIAADAFFQGMFTTALEADEMLTAVHFPNPKRSAYAKFRHPASRYALAGVCLTQVMDGSVRVALTGVFPCVMRWLAAEAALSADFTPASLADLTLDASEALSDIHAQGDYRCHLAQVMLKRAVVQALA
jgi:aerobic carbon-monoxide dehydrogenase medium subunit